MAAGAAREAADAAAAASVADLQPPAAPSVAAAGAVTAAAVDVASMSSAERRKLLAKLGGFMGDEKGTSARGPPMAHVACACFLSLAIQGLLFGSKAPTRVSAQIEVKRTKEKTPKVTSRSTI